MAFAPELMFSGSYGDCMTHCSSLLLHFILLGLSSLYNWSTLGFDNGSLTYSVTKVDGWYAEIATLCSAMYC